MRFSQKIGKTPIRVTLQVEGIEPRLKNQLWNAFHEGFFLNFHDSLENGGPRAQLCKIIWQEFYGLRLDQIPTWSGRRISTGSVLNYIDEWFFNKADWYEIYDFIEFLLEVDLISQRGFIDTCNTTLIKEGAGYRVINGAVVQITSDEEIHSIEEALNTTDIFKPVNSHLSRALDLLANREAPDYRNSIKESISAVEALCIIIVQDKKASLGKALAIIEKEYELHSSLKEAYSKIYGYTSDADGIRHAMLDDGLPIEFEDAKFMLVSCSAFINYLKAKLKL